MSDKPKIGFGAQAEAEPKKPKKARAKKSEVDPRQLKAVEGKLAGKSSYQAAIDAGYSHSMAAKANTKVFTPPVRDEWGAALEAAGVTLSLMARRVRRNLSAQTVKTASFEGKITDTRKFRDGRLINDTVRLVAELRGDLKPDNVGNTNQVVVVIERIGRPRSTDQISAEAGNCLVLARPKSG